MLIQSTSVQAFKGGEAIEHYLRQSRRVVRAFGRYIANLLRGAKASVTQPEGGYYLCPDLSQWQDNLASSNMRTSPEFCEALQQGTEVASLAGTEFGRLALRQWASRQLILNSSFT